MTHLRDFAFICRVDDSQIDKQSSDYIPMPDLSLFLAIHELSDPRCCPLSQFIVESLNKQLSIREQKSNTQKSKGLQFHVT